MLAGLRSSFRGTKFRSLLRNATFLRLFSGRVVTDAGDSIYFIAAMWLVWELTGSAFYTGLAGALIQIPNALSFLVGPLVDRWRLRRILLSTQLINGIGVLIVPFAAVTGHLSVWLLLLLMPTLHFVNGFVYPAQNAALPRIVKDGELTRANSLFSLSLRTVDMIGNAAAGALIAIVGAVALFVVNAATFAVAAVLFLGVAVPGERNDATANESDGIDLARFGRSYLDELVEGVTYVRGSTFSAMLLGMMFGNFVTIAANVVLPAFADSISGPEAYGLLVASMGAGNLVGGGGAFLVEKYSVGRVAIAGNLVSAVLWFAAIALPGLWPTAILFFAATIPVGAFNVLFGSMYQSAVDETILGRVSSLTRTLSTAMMPAGAFLGGVAASHLGSVTVMYLTSGVMALLGLYYLVHPGLRSLPSIAAANEMTLGLQPIDATDD